MLISTQKKVFLESYLATFLKNLENLNPMSNSELRYSSLTKKYIMALAGLFLITYLFVHLGINLLILLPGTDTTQDREVFNKAAYFMSSFPVIRVFEIVLFGGFIIHILYGFIVQIQNWIARPRRYKIEGWSHTSPFSKFMIHTGILILIFLVIHLIDFYFKAKIFGHVRDVTYDGVTYHDTGALVIQKFKMLGFVIAYIVAFVFLGFHLHHAFWSAFQSMGWDHSKYTPFIKGVSLFVSIVIPVGFTIIPLVIYFSPYYHV